jgi:hypothetical protein
LAACSGGDAVITYNAAYCDAHTVKIDDTLRLKSTDDMLFATHKLKKGDHTLTIDDAKPVSFEVDEDGILNLAHEEFVIFPIKYTLGDQTIHETSGVGNKLLIDSFVVGSKSPYMAFGSGYTKYDLKKLKNGSEETELRKTDSNKLVINKAWDLGITDEIPRTMNESMQKGTTSATTYRKKVLEAKQFMRFAKATGTFVVMPLSAFPD